MARKARTPSGEVWHVRRLLLPDAVRPDASADVFSRTWRVVRGTEASLPTVGVQYGVPPGNVQMFGMESLAGLMASVLLLLLAPILLPVAVVGRLVLRRPWWVEAKHGGVLLRWRVRGFRAAGHARDEVARQLEAGTREPSPAGAARVYYWGPRTLLERLERERRTSAGSDV